MQVTSYGKLLEEVEKPNQAEQLRLLEQIAVLIRSKAKVRTRLPPFSIAHKYHAEE